MEDEIGRLEDELFALGDGFAEGETDQYLLDVYVADTRHVGIFGAYDPVAEEGTQPGGKVVGGSIDDL